MNGIRISYNDRDYEVHGKFHRGYRQTWDSPAEPAEIEILEIYDENGDLVDEELHEEIVANCYQNVLDLVVEMREEQAEQRRYGY